MGSSPDGQPFPGQRQEQSCVAQTGLSSLRKLLEANLYLFAPLRSFAS